MALHLESRGLSQPSAPPSRSISLVVSPGPEPFARAMQRAAARVDEGEALLQRTAHGNLGGLDAGTLIALQAGIYRYTEVVDLAGKLVDRASNAVRSVLQSGSH